MNTGDRYDIFDKLPVLLMKFWPDEEEMEKFGKTYHEWMELLGHEVARREDGTPRGCKTCGRGVTCILDVFFEGIITATILELDKLGYLRSFPTRSFSSIEEFERGILDGQ